MNKRSERRWILIFAEDFDSSVEEWMSFVEGFDGASIFVEMNSLNMKLQSINILLGGSGNMIISHLSLRLVEGRI